MVTEIRTIGLAIPSNTHNHHETELHNKPILDAVDRR